MKEALLIGVLSAGTAYADNHVVDELVMLTEVGEIVLTVEECDLYDYMPQKYHANFKYKAYATDSETKSPHLGCWTTADQTVYIQFPELGDVLATYKKDLFKPREL